MKRGKKERGKKEKVAICLPLKKGGRGKKGKRTPN